MGPGMCPITCSRSHGEKGELAVCICRSQEWLVRLRTLTEVIIISPASFALKTTVSQPLPAIFPSLKTFAISILFSF